MFFEVVVIGFFLYFVGINKCLCGSGSGWGEVKRKDVVLKI